MRLIIALLFLSSLCQAKAAYVVNGNLTMTDVGMEATGSDHQYAHSLYTLTNGEPRVMYGFLSSGNASQLWDFGLSNSVSRVLTLTNGYPTTRVQVVTTNNTVIVGTASIGRLWEYYPTTGALVLLTNCSNNGYYTGIVGTDNDAHFGTYGNTLSTAVETFHTATHTITQWGKMDADETADAYVYYIGGDASYIYGVIRTDTKWYVSIIRRSDGVRASWWKDNTSTLVIRKSADDGQFYLTSASVYQFNGLAEPTLLGSTPNWVPTYAASNQNYDDTTWASEEGWEVEPVFSVVSIDGSTPQASVRFRKTGETDWTTITETDDWLLGPYTFRHLVPLDADTLIWTTRDYGPIGLLESNNDYSMVYATAGLSWYNILTTSSTAVYLSGYHDKTKLWNPQATWTWTPTTADDDLDANPHMATLSSIGKYHYYAAKANDGRIYVGGQVAYDSSVGVLGWFTPFGKNTATFTTHGINDLVAAEGGTKMVYVSNNSDGKVYVWDVATDTVLTNFSPLGSVTLDKVVEYQSGKIFGLRGVSAYAFTTSGSLLYSNSIPSAAWGGTTPIPTAEHTINLGPDGYVWQCAGNKLYRINPQTGASTELISTTHNYNTVFLGLDLYLFGGDYGTAVWRISNALVATNTVRSTGLRLGNLKGR